MIYNWRTIFWFQYTVIQSLFSDKLSGFIKAQEFSISDSLFFLTGTYWLWTGTDSWFFTRWVPGPTITFCNKITALSVLGSCLCFLLSFLQQKQQVSLLMLMALWRGVLVVMGYYALTFSRLRAVFLFLSPSCETRETRKWPRAWPEGARRERHEKRETTSGLVSSVSWLRRSTLARAWTPFTESGENERLLAV